MLERVFELEGYGLHDNAIIDLIGVQARGFSSVRLLGCRRNWNAWNWTSTSVMTSLLT